MMERVVDCANLSGRRIAMIWMRIGAYHLARARGAHEVLVKCGASLVVAEVSSQDHYPWEVVSEDERLRIRTLFPDRGYAELRQREVYARVLEWLEEERVDVVFSNGWASAEARAVLAWSRESLERRCVVMSETKADDLPRKFWREWVKRYVLRGADAGLVGGRAQADYLASLGIPRDRIFLGYNAVDNAYFASAASVARQQAPPFSGKRYFFACTRFLARKNLDGLLRAFAIYRRVEGSGAWDLAISGSGEEESNLRECAISLGLESSVHWLGFVQYGALPYWYGHAAGFVHPAVCEPWGLVVNEAAACGLPLLVAAPVGARYELVEDGVSGFIFDPFSETKIANALSRLGQLSAVERERMGVVALTRVQSFGPERFASGVLSAAQACIGS